MKYSGIYFCLLCLLFTSSSCDENLLQEISKGVVSEAQFWQTQEEVEMGIRAAYYKVGASFNGGYGLWQYVIEDLGVDYTDAACFHTYISYSDWSSISPNFTDWGIWGNLWGLIRDTNRLLDKVPKAPIDTAVQERVLGEAYALRALGYFTLVNWFGSVPEVIAYDEMKTEIPRASYSSNYSLIESDLLAAIQLLPSKSSLVAISEKEYGRLAKGAAQGLLARVYLQQEKWLEVINLTEEIIQSNEYALETNYLNIFSIENQGFTNSELLWSMLFSSTSLAEPPQFQMLMVYLFKAPEITAYNHFNEWGGNMRLTTDFFNSFETGDQRKNGLYYSMTAASWGIQNPVMLVKYPADTESTGEGNGNNYPFIRYADILLMRAEALNNLGNQSEAIVEVNKVRSRAGLGALDESLHDQKSLATHILQERRWEFYFEGHGKRDLKRMHPELLKDHIKSVSSDWEAKGVESYFILPIPENALRANPLLEQNPGF